MIELRRHFPRWLPPLPLAILFLFIFCHATVPAWKEARTIREERDRLYQETVQTQSEIQRYREEKKNLEQSYFYNERLRRLMFQTGPETAKKK